MPLTWPENSDLAEECFRTVVFLDAAVKLHQAALAPKSEDRSQELRELVSRYYEQLCFAVRAHSDSRESLHKQLVSRAGGLRSSPLSRNHRYALNLKPILWPPNQPPPRVGVNGALDDKDLERALKNLDDKDVLARLRSISIPDFEQEQEEMETEVCTVDHWRRDIERAAERGAEAVMDRTRQSDERTIGQISDAIERLERALAPHEPDKSALPEEPKPPSDAGSPQDGPTEEYVFYWRGKETELQPVPWRLLKYVWDCEHRKASITNVIDEVWGHESASDAAIKTAISKANQSLARKDIPVTVRQKQGWVLIEIPK